MWFKTLNYCDIGYENHWATGSEPDKARKHIWIHQWCSKYTRDRLHRMVIDTVRGVGGGQIECEVAQIRSKGYPSVEIAFIYIAFHVENRFPGTSQLKCLNYEFISHNMQLFISCRLLWCFYQLFGLSFWRHPFTAADPLVSKWCNANYFHLFHWQTVHLG